MTPSSVLPQAMATLLVTWFYLSRIALCDRVCYANTYIKIGTIQRRLAWPLRKDDRQIHEAFHFINNLK